MANKLYPMDIKQILVLIKDGYSNRKIGATLGISRNTVNNYVHQFNSSGYSISQLLSFDEIRLSELFTSKTTIDTSRHDDLMRYLERINAARSHPGFTFQYHYNDYVNNVSTPYEAWGNERKDKNNHQVVELNNRKDEYIHANTISNCFQHKIP